MNINNRILLVSLFAGISALASAQNLDPTVVVSRDYEGKLMEVHKPRIEMAVPDSVLRFDLDFDYSVSDSPYKGAYDFTPYVLDMRPAASVRETNHLYLNAGAGYQLHPELDVVWSPSLKNKSFRMNLYGRHRSYVGQYWNIEPVQPSQGLVFDRAASDEVWNGMDMLNKAGMDGRLDWKRGVLTFEAGYDGLVQQDRREDGTSRSFNAFDASLSLSSKDKTNARAGYHLDIDYRTGNDALTRNEQVSLSESVLSADASLFLSLKKRNRFCLDFDYDMAGYSGYFNSAASLLTITPHYVRMGRMWDFDFGVMLAKVFRAKEMSDMYQDRIQAVYPDVKIGFKGIPAMYLYLASGGGPSLETYSSLLQWDRHINVFYGKGMLDVSDHSFYALAGLDGRITPRFTYEFKAGYSRHANTPLAMVTYDAESRSYLPGVTYGQYSRMFASLEFKVAAERFDMNAFAEYSHHLGKQQACVLLPAAFKGNLSFRYNWMRRIYAGVTCDASSAMRGKLTYLYGGEMVTAPDAVPGYVDLGVDLEYVINRKISLWAKGRNLMGMTIQRSLFYAERGPYFTLGFCFNI